MFIKFAIFKAKFEKTKQLITFKLIHKIFGLSIENNVIKVYGDIFYFNTVGRFILEKGFCLYIRNVKKQMIVIFREPLGALKYKKINNFKLEFVFNFFN